MRTLLTIIVPVYNTERYIRICLKNILLSTLRDFELVVVDDGSTDNSLSICKEFERQDDRVRVFESSHAGVSRARNIGLDNARGTWVTFVDADDVISKTFLENLSKPILHDESIDFVLAGFMNLWGGKTNRRITYNQIYKNYLGNDYNILLNNYRGAVYSKLFRRTLIETGFDNSPIRFDQNITVAEDMVFTADYICLVNKYAIIDECGYFYRRDNALSVTRSIQRPSYTSAYSVSTHLYNSLERYKNMHGIMEEQCQFRYKIIASSLLHSIYALYFDKYRRKDRLRMLKSNYCSRFLYILSLSDKRFIDKVVVELLNRKWYSTLDVLGSMLSFFYPKLKALSVFFKNILLLRNKCVIL